MTIDLPLGACVGANAAGDTRWIPWGAEPNAVRQPPPRRLKGNRPGRVYRPDPARRRCRGIHRPRVPRGDVDVALVRVGVAVTPSLRMPRSHHERP